MPRTGAKTYSKGCGLGMFQCRQLAQLPVAGIPSGPVYSSLSRTGGLWPAMRPVANVAV